MRLTAWEEERLLIFTAAELARRHRDRGLLLNAPEVVALICDAMLEAARAGASYAEVEAAGRAAVTRRPGLPGVAALVAEVRLEVLLDDGARLVVLLEPLGPAGDDAPGADPPGRRPRRPRRRPPRALRARGPQHLDPRRPRLEPLPVRAGQPAARVRSSGARPASGSTSPPARPSAGRPARPRTVDPGPASDVKPASPRPSASPATARRPATASASATPTCGSASSDDRQAPGDEPIWGYAKTLRPRVDPGPAVATPSSTSVIAGALVLDPVLGAVKADIGIKDGRIVGVGRAGNERHQRRHRAADRAAHPADHGLRPHRHARRGRQPRPPHLAGAAARRAVRRRDDAHHRRASRSRRGRWRGRSPRIADWPLNVGLQACARAEDDGSLEALLDAGACGFKIHEDYGAVPGAHRPHAALRRGARRHASRSTPTACTRAPSSRTRSPRSTAGPSTPTTSRAAAAATCPTSSASSASRTSSARRRRRPCRGASTPPPSRCR